MTFSVSFAFDVKDEESANAWLEEARTLNEEARTKVTEAANLLESFQETATGKVFDQVVELSSQVIEGASKIAEGMNDILTVLNDVLKTIKENMPDLVGTVTDAATKIFG